jgi:hypothetical protein
VTTHCSALRSAVMKAGGCGSWCTQAIRTSAPQLALPAAAQRLQRTENVALVTTARRLLTCGCLHMIVGVGHRHQCNVRLRVLPSFARTCMIMPPCHRYHGNSSSHNLLVPHAWTNRFSTTSMLPSWHILARMIKRRVCKLHELLSL